MPAASPKEIARRLKEKRALEKTALDGRTLDVLREFLSLNMPPHRCAGVLWQLLPKTPA